MFASFGYPETQFVIEEGRFARLYTDEFSGLGHHYYYRIRRGHFASKLEKPSDGSTCSPASGFHSVCFWIWDEYRFALPPRAKPGIISPLHLRSCQCRLSLVMKGVLCFNNGQHRASNSSGKVKTRNIYFAQTVANRNRHMICRCVCMYIYVYTARYA